MSISMYAASAPVFARMLGNMLNWMEAAKAHAEAKKEMLEIYGWWTQDRKIEHDRGDALLHAAYAGPVEFERMVDGMYRLKKFPVTEEEERLRAQCRLMEDALEAKDEEMMIRLIKIRGYMWT